MGIRYYAYPINAEDYPRACENPCPFHGSDPLADAWGPRENQPEMLYLDKCWRELQLLLGSPAGQASRPAARLVEGQVTHTDMGWIPYEQALSPAQVRSIAEDLATVGQSDIRRELPTFIRPQISEDDEFENVAQYLAEATKFTARLASEGRGLVYLIG